MAFMNIDLLTEFLMSNLIIVAAGGYDMIVTLVRLTSSFYFQKDGYNGDARMGSYSNSIFFAYERRNGT